MKLPGLSAALLAGLLASPPALAVGTHTWRITSYRDFDEGEAQGVLLSSLGEAQAGVTTTRIELAEAQVYSSLLAPDGTVWLGTGDQAQLYAWDEARGLRKVAHLEGVLVAALAMAPDGTLYAGALPGGKVWKIEGGQATELCKLPGAEHVWSLLVEGNLLYAATGPGGQVFAIDRASGKSRLLWDSGGKQILVWTKDGRGGFLAGSADDAILYRVAPDGVARALHDFEGDEVRAIDRRGDTLYVAVNDFEQAKSSPLFSSSSSSTVSTPAPPKTAVPAPPPVSSSSAQRERKGKGAIYRIDQDGRVEQLHALADNYFTALHVDAHDNLFAAAGTNGRLYLIKPDRTVMTMLDLPERQILTLAFGGNPSGKAGDLKLVGTGDAGALYRVDGLPPRNASYVSKVLDASFPARWGTVRWSATGKVKIETRSGNTVRPDKTWSPWLALAPGPDRIDEHEAKAGSPPGRYLQLRIAFTQGAVLRDVTTYYLPQNQRPRVAEIMVGDDPAQKLARAARSAGKPRSPVVKIKWKVENSDDDDLVYRLFYREEVELSWKPLGGPEPLTAREWEWNTEAIPDGNYLLKMVASDERSNPRGEALEHFLISTPFLVDNRKPEVTALAVTYPFAAGTARDSFSPISELAYSLDGDDWQPLAPRDAIFDERIEDFSLRLPAELAPGMHSLVVRAVDAADNVGSSQVTFRVK